MPHHHNHPHTDTVAGAHAGHRHAPPAGTRAYVVGIALNLGFTLFEAVWGLLTGSLALLSDALHNLGDVLGLVLAGAAAWLALRPASARRTYGYRRATVLAPLANGLLLVAASGALGWEALRRLAQPPEVAAIPVIVVAAVGIAINLGSALLFRGGHAHDINQRGAYLHLMADAAVSLAVVFGGVGMWWLGWRWLDPALALGVGIVIAITSWGLLRESLDLALDAVPRGVERDAVAAFLAQQDGVAAVHHVHIWALGSREIALTAHLVRPDADIDDAFVATLGTRLRERFGIAHATLQVERGGDRDAPQHACRAGG
ncbi:cation diffusion facilitator family transporter [Chiayiivirga flava]|uniref:Cobalt-zinc-cadmium efflux system protein n=1 Tax=Chiayiivirga flava TaxID=659595 RepID=A0A7W8D2X0_9GAMM|nr:cation diffusion facilitator family transporter [Chiayiivirga flava]MBB5206921.1 cobalt-zinc-cadmium efflux system protein [Chiayiivirga flava]